MWRRWLPLSLERDAGCWSVGHLSPRVGVPSCSLCFLPQRRRRLGYRPVLVCPTGAPVRRRRFFLPDHLLRCPGINYFGGSRWRAPSWLLGPCSPRRLRSALCGFSSMSWRGSSRPTPLFPSYRHKPGGPIRFPGKPILVCSPTETIPRRCSSWVLSSRLVSCSGKWRAATRSPRRFPPSGVRRLLRRSCSSAARGPEWFAWLWALSCGRREPPVRPSIDAPLWGPRPF